MSVTAETHRVDFAMGRDLRLLRAVGAAIAILGDEIGFDPSATQNLGAAAEATCEEAFLELPAEAPELDVTVESFSDRLEITLARRGKGEPEAGREPEPSLAAPQPLRRGALLQNVDRVQHDSTGGVVRTRLVKYLSRKA
jgi:hypothetical protein